MVAQLNNVFLDTNRLIKPLQRRLHAAWHEMRGERTLTVPAAGWELARGLDLSSPEDLAESRVRLSGRLRSGANHIRGREATRLRVQIWWAEAWLSKDSPHEMRFLSPDEQEKAWLLLEHIDPACFPSADADALSTHRDAMIICEVLACGGKVLLTSNMELVDEVLVNQWVRENQQAYDLADERVVYPVDEALLELMRTPDERQSFLNAAWGAYWPDDADVPLQEAHDACRDALSKLAEPSSHLRRTAQHLLNAWQADPHPNERMESLRASLPKRTRTWERKHPAYPSP